MEVFPLIYSKTFGADYCSKFAVRPPYFKDSDIKWARGKISTIIQRPTGFLHVVASKGEICIAGIVCTMNYFVNNRLTGDEQKAAQPYAEDSFGRNYGVFLGCAFKKGAAPEITYSNLWKWFEKYLSPYWNRKYFDGVKSEQEDCDSLPRADYDFSPTEKCFDAQIYDSAAFDDAELFNMYLFETANRDVAFCSNVENIQRVEEGTYNAVTTSASNITMLEAHWEKELDRRKKEAEKAALRLEETKHPHQEQLQPEETEHQHQEQFQPEEKSEPRRTATNSQKKNPKPYSTQSKNKSTGSNKIDNEEISVGACVSSLNAFSRDFILVDETTGKRFRITFRLGKEGFLRTKPSIECKLEEIR